MEKLRFYCKCCKLSFDVNVDEDDFTTGSGCCKTCGSSNWSLINKKTNMIVE